MNYKCISNIDQCSSLSDHIPCVNSCNLTLPVSDYTCELARPIKVMKQNAFVEDNCLFKNSIGEPTDENYLSVGCWEW